MYQLRNRHLGGSLSALALYSFDGCTKLWFVSTLPLGRAIRKEVKDSETQHFAAYGSGSYGGDDRLSKPSRGTSF